MLTATKLRYDNFITAFAVNKWQRADLAAIEAGFAKSCAKQTAHRLVTTDYCKKAIAKIQATQAVKTGFTMADAQRMYEEDRDFASTVNQAGARVSATTGICRLYGMDKDAGSGEKTVIIISPKVVADKPKLIDSKKKTMKYEIRCIYCEEPLSIERVWMNGANDVTKETRTTKIVFHIKPCSCKPKPIESQQIDQNSLEGSQEADIEDIER